MGHRSATPPANCLHSVTASLKSGTQGKEVNNLNQCLVFLLINGAGIIDKSLLDPVRRLNWLNDLFHQKIEQYGTVTTSLIQLFQKKQQLAVTGAVDQETANRLNAVLIHTGAFDQPTPNKGSVYKSNRSVAHNGQQKIPFVDVGLQQGQLIQTIEPLQQVHDGNGKLEKPEVDVDAISAHLLRLSVKNGEYTYAKADDIVMVESSDQ